MKNTKGHKVYAVCGNYTQERLNKYNVPLTVGKVYAVLGYDFDRRCGVTYYHVVNDAGQVRREHENYFTEVYVEE